MNWNEWRFKWGMFWLFVLVLIITVVGCGSKPNVLDPIDDNNYQEPPLDNCQITELMGRQPGPECENLRLA